MPIQEPIIDKFIGCEVDILYLTDNSAYHDRGVIEENDGQWIALRKSGKELFLIPITSIRLIKTPNNLKDPTSLLLRPVEPEAPAEQEQELKSKS